MHLSIKDVSGYILKNDNGKFLIIDKNNKDTFKYYFLLSRLKSIIASGEGRKEQFINFNNEYEKNKFLSDDESIPDELLYFNELIILIRCIFREGYTIYPQIYLQSVNYELYK